MKNYDARDSVAPSVPPPSLGRALLRADRVIDAIAVRWGYVHDALWRRLLEYGKTPFPPLAAWRLKANLEAILLSSPGYRPEDVRSEVRLLEDAILGGWRDNAAAAHGARVLLRSRL